MSDITSRDIELVMRLNPKNDGTMRGCKPPSYSILDHLEESKKFILLK
jgi:hypothetical protein